MRSLRIFLLSSILVVLSHHLPLTGADTNCGSNISFVSTDFTLNLRTLLFSFSQNVDNYGFYNTSVGVNPNVVYGSALCRADIQLVECRSCIRSTTIEIVRLCPNSNQAVTWSSWDDTSDYDCIIRYSNESMFGVLAMPTKYPSWTWPSNAVVSRPEFFNEDLLSLSQNLRDKAVRGGSLLKVAAGNITTAGLQTIYLMLQCTPDLITADCRICLNRCIQTIPDCRNGTWCVLILSSCNYYYWIVKFYNETRLEELSTPPSPFPSLPPRPTQPLPPPRPIPTPQEENKGGNQTIIIVVVSVIASLLSLCGIGFLCMKKRNNKFNEATRNRSPSYKNDLQEIITPESLQYDFLQIRDATHCFSSEKMLGKGGFGAVYRGKLPNGIDIAVKRLGENSGQGVEEFKNEVLLAANLQHKNLVKLFGFCIHGIEKLLIYEFVENTSLDKFIFDSTQRSRLTWETRYNIIMGIAKGLLYLHEDSRHMIIHRDLKSGNILLDREMNPKIADFGIARQFVPDITHAFTATIVGTNGYMAPEYALHGHISTKSDVFSFGVLVIEIISGKQNNSCREGMLINLVNEAWRHWRQGTISNMIDPVLILGANKFEAIMRCMNIGLLCVQENPNVRPTMASIVQMLPSLLMEIPSPSGH